MANRIPSFGVRLVDLATGIIKTEWFRFLEGMWSLVPAVTITAVATLDFPNTAANAVSDLTVPMAGVLLGDAVTLGVPAASVPAGGSYFGWVSAADTVTVRYVNNTAGALDPASGAFLLVVTRY